MSHWEESLEFKERQAREIEKLRAQVEALTKERDDFERRLIYRETETAQLIKAGEQKLAAFRKDVAEAFERMLGQYEEGFDWGQSIPISIIRKERDKLREK